MAKLSSLTIARSVATVTYGDETFRVGYNPERITQAWLTKLQVFGEQARAEVITDDAARTLFAETALEILLDWEVTEDDGVTPVPLTVAALRATALTFQSHLLQTLIEDLQTKNRSGTASPTKSRRSTSRKAK